MYHTILPTALSTHRVSSPGFIFSISGDMTLRCSLSVSTPRALYRENQTALY